MPANSLDSATNAIQEGRRRVVRVLGSTDVQLTTIECRRSIVASNRVRKLILCIDLIKENPKQSPPVIDWFAAQKQRNRKPDQHVEPYGKSWGAYGLGISVAMGGTGLDSATIRKGRVSADRQRSWHKSHACVDRIPKVGRRYWVANTASVRDGRRFTAKTSTVDLPLRR